MYLTGTATRWARNNTTDGNQMADTENIVTGAVGSNSYTMAEVSAMYSEAVAYASSQRSTGTKDEDGSTTLFGGVRVNNTNAFEKYAQMSLLSSHVFIPLLKMGLTLVNGFRLEEGIPDATEALAKMNEWAQDVGLENKAQNIVRCVIRDGTTVVYMPKKSLHWKTKEKMEKNGVKLKKGISGLDILPMQYASLLPEGFDIGNDGAELMKGDIKSVVLEEPINKKNINTILSLNDNKVYARKEVAIFRFFHEGYMMKDRLGRQTYGLYGMSFLEAIEQSVRNHADLVYGFSGYVRRYGVGRLHIDIPMAAQLMEQGRIEDAGKILSSVLTAQRNIKPNEDIVTGGTTVKSLGTGSAPNIKEMKESFEADIHVGLLQSPISMGNTKNSSYASGYMSEQDRMMVLNTLQTIFLKTLQTEIIDKQLIELGYQAGTVKAMAARLDRPMLSDQDVLDAEDRGVLEKAEARVHLGYPPIPEKSMVNVDDEDEIIE